MAMDYGKSDSAYENMEKIINQATELKGKLSPSVLETSEGTFDNINAKLDEVIQYYTDNRETVKTNKEAMEAIEEKLSAGEV